MFFGPNPPKIRHFSCKWAFFLIYFNIWHLFLTIWQNFQKIIIFALQQDKIFLKPLLSKIRIFWKNIHPCLLLPPIATHLQWREYEGSGVHDLCSTWSPGGARAATRRRMSWGPRCRSWGSPPSCRAPRAGSGNCQSGREEKTKKQGFLITTILCQNFLNGVYCKIRILKEEC